MVVFQTNEFSTALSCCMRGAGLQLSVIPKWTGTEPALRCLPDLFVVNDVAGTIGEYITSGATALTTPQMFGCLW